ncbi:MAG: hypothetical protein AABX23_03945 [Nanoarchaeota archaeon]
MEEIHVKTLDRDDEVKAAIILFLSMLHEKQRRLGLHPECRIQLGRENAGVRKGKVDHELVADALERWHLA